MMVQHILSFYSTPSKISIHPPRESPPPSCLLWLAAAHASSQEAVEVVVNDVGKYADLQPNQIS